MQTVVLDNHITLINPFITVSQDTKSLEDNKLGVKGLGRKKTDESEHFFWNDDIKVPCGRLIPSEHKNSFLEYNEYAVYDPKQVMPLVLILLFITSREQVNNYLSTDLIISRFLTDKHKVLGGSEI